MDVVTGLLDGPRARGAFLLRAIMDPPWSIWIEDRAPLTVVVLVQGEAWVVYEERDPVRLRRGDVAIMRAPQPYTIADDPATPTQVVIHPGQRCTTVAGDDLAETMGLGVRTWGNSLHGSVTMLVGTYRMEGEVSKRLLGVLPQLVVLPNDASGSPLIPLLESEIDKDEPGQEAVLDRLLDLLIIGVLRTWFTRPGDGEPTWYRAQSDPVVGRAIQLLHHNPADPWTIERLARACGVSRAALARRFTDLVGEPPMTFLTGWRLALAADLLADPDATLTSVARQVGYGSPFALSAAFKRVRGITPQQHRRRAAIAS